MSYNKISLFVAVFPYSNAYFGSNNTLPIRIDDTRCTGTEADLIHCAHDIFVSGCQHSDDAGVRCTAGCKLWYSTNFYHSGFILHACSIINHTTTAECTHGSVRLVGGTVSNEGRLEVCLYGIWGTVTDDNFGTQDATVVCRQLSHYPNCMKITFMY